MEGIEISKVYVEDYVLKIEWLVPEWEQWQELQTDKEYMDLKADGQQKLDAAKKRVSKGKGRSDKDTA